MSEGIDNAVRLDALLRLQFEEQNQSRHHENLRDRAIGNMSLVNAALLAILGALYQAKLEESPALIEAAKYLIPFVVLVFGTFSCVVSLRHSIQAERHWELGRLFRARALPLVAPDIPDARKVISDQFARRGWLTPLFERFDNPGGGLTRLLWMGLPAFMALAGAVMILIALWSDWMGSKPDRPPTNVRVQIGTDGMLTISPSTLREWSDLQRRTTGEASPASEAPTRSE